jgi:hypothetical protein
MEDDQIKKSRSRSHFQPDDLFPRRTTPSTELEAKGRAHLCNFGDNGFFDQPHFNSHDYSLIPLL